MVNIEEGKRIVYTDKTLIPNRTLMKHAISKPWSNVSMPKLPPRQRAISIVVAVNKQRELESAVVYEHSVNSQNFLDAISTI